MSRRGLAAHGEGRKIAGLNFRMLHCQKARRAISKHPGANEKLLMQVEDERYVSRYTMTESHIRPKQHVLAMAFLSLSGLALAFAPNRIPGAAVSMHAAPYDRAALSLLWNDARFHSDGGRISAAKQSWLTRGGGGTLRGLSGVVVAYRGSTPFLVDDQA